MSYLTDEQRRKKLDERAEIVLEWLLWIEQLYADLLSREAETGSLSGFDPLPTTRPCEHRLKWYRGDLCLACSNTGWRPLWPIEDKAQELIVADLLEAERESEWRKWLTKKRYPYTPIDQVLLGCDRYGFELPKSRINLMTNEASRKEAEASRLEAILDALDRHAKIREGQDIEESRELRQFRIVAQKTTQAKKVIAALHRIQQYGFVNFLDRREMCLLIAILTGPLRPPKVVAD